MLVWKPTTNHEIELTRERRRAQRLERRLKMLRRAQLRLVYRDDIVAIEKELAVLCGDCGGRG